LPEIARGPLPGNNIYHRPYHTQNNHHQADVDPYNIGYPTPVPKDPRQDIGLWTGGNRRIGKEVKNNLEVYGSCSLC
jgi:hypothetical protein